jgi:quercetin dioxygenase-like cupin family protein
MALPHAQPFESIDLSPLGEQMREAVTSSLIKARSLQLMRIVMRAGEQLPMHHVRGEITLQCIEGNAVVLTPGRSIALAAGHVVLLPAAEPHAVQALADTTVLVTVSLAAPAA